MTFRFVASQRLVFRKKEVKVELPLVAFFAFFCQGPLGVMQSAICKAQMQYAKFICNMRFGRLHKHAIRQNFMMLLVFFSLL